MRLTLMVAAVAALAVATQAETPNVTHAPLPAASADDPYLWLEDLESPRALAWVETQNARSLALLKGDARYKPFHEEALAIVDAADRIPAPAMVGRAVFNFWQDPGNVRGLWRRTTAQSYAEPNPVWETVLDLDALSAAEKANWVWKGANCPPPRYAHCLINLSDGGEDAVRAREFDLAAKRFTPGGFDLPRGKQSADWLDDDTLILAREWGPGTLTQSGYPFVVKTLRRGQGLDAATEVFRGEPMDVSVDPAVLHDGQGHKAVLIIRAVSFFESKVYLLAPRGLIPLPLPLKSSVEGLIDGQLIVSLKQDWSPAAGAARLPQGALIALDLKAVEEGGPPRVALLIAPGARQSIEQVAVTKSRVVAALYDNVRGGLVTFAPDGGAWRQGRLHVAANASVGDRRRQRP